MTMAPLTGARSASSAFRTSSLYHAEKSSPWGVTPRPFLSSATPIRVVSGTAATGRRKPVHDGGTSHGGERDGGSASRRSGSRRREGGRDLRRDAGRGPAGADSDSDPVPRNLRRWRRGGRGRQ